MWDYGALSYLQDLEEQKGGGDALKSLFGVAMQATRRNNFLWEKGVLIM